MPTQIRIIVKHIEKMEEKFFLVSEGDKIFRIPLNEIFHFTARRSLTIVTTKEKQYVHGKNIGNVKKEVDGNGNFTQTHKSYLLNMNHVICFSKKGDGCAILKDGSEVPVARRRKKNFLKHMSQINVTVGF